ncbi:class I SAM-dependent methyltransferase [Haliovirga abyssi]|uniref:Methyltransferase type 11 n=1 Tax=Haliovirga abyssi TaxID=2996794 RepID=A0AAU9D814_9FUSO|nr:class I SAM-dependent methyltransferase [Haliovirga abyssi]BDU49716.1 methyltransferase type 11 [Haliovirga abyssi]
MIKLTNENYNDFIDLPFDSIRNKILDIIKEKKAKKIVDLCCGAGEQLTLLKENGYDNIIGIDISDHMLEIANLGEDKPICKKGDATNTDFKDNSFDVAIISFALHDKSLNSQKTLLKEAKRIVKKNMYIIIVDYNFDKKTERLGEVGVELIEQAPNEHYENYKKYIKKGGLDSLVKGKFIKIEEYYFYFNAVRCRVYKN